MIQAEKFDKKVQGKMVGGPSFLIGPPRGARKGYVGGFPFLEGRNSFTPVNIG